MRLYLLLVCLHLTACSTVGAWLGWEGEEEEVVSTPKRTRSIRPASASQLELRVAKLWTRVDELEAENRNQKARLKVLERGLVLGLTPDELIHPSDRAYKKYKKPMTKTPKKEKTKQPTVPTMTKSATAPAVGEGKKDYQELITTAQDHFQQGRYGRAIAEFSQVSQMYPDRAKEGSHLYWIALSWARLKEYQTAKSRFAEFLADHGSSPWAPRAKFYLAKIEYKTGLREQALKRFRDLIKTHPNEDAAEMARNEMTTLEKTL